MRRKAFLIGAGLLAGLAWWVARPETRAAGPQEALHLQEPPIAHSLTTQSMVWIERADGEVGSSVLWHYDMASGRREQLYQGRFLRFVHQLEDGRVLFVEAGEPDTPEGGPTVFPRARILLHEDGRVRVLVEPAPYCVEALLAGESVYWVSTPPGEAQRLPFLQAWGRADLMVTRQGQSERLASLQAPGGWWQGRLLGVDGDDLYAVELYSLANERAYNRLLRIHAGSGGSQIALTWEGRGDWFLARGGVYGAVSSPESQHSSIDTAVLRWTPDRGLEWLTDWLASRGKLASDGKRVYYAELNGLWEIPEQLDPARKRAGRVGHPFDVAVGDRGAWVLTQAYNEQSMPDGWRLIFRRFGEYMSFSKEVDL